MKRDQYRHRSWYVLGAALALTATTAFANSVDAQLSAAEISAMLAVADSTETLPMAAGSTAPRNPSSEEGVRRAAAQGPAALHHYIFRTRMIYNYYFWDFAKDE